MQDFSESVRKQIKQLCDRAYKAELEAALRDVEAGFADWRKDRLDCFELSDLIHDFHQGPNRSLYNYYSRVKPHMAAARAIAEGLVPRDEVPQEVIATLAADWTLMNGSRRTSRSQRTTRSDERRLTTPALLPG